MPLDTRKMDAVIAHCDALGKRLDSLSKRRSDARQARKDGARADATDRRQAVGRELELLKSHLTDMTEAHERERVEAKIADLEAESETLAAEPKADKGSKSK